MNLLDDFLGTAPEAGGNRADRPDRSCPGSNEL